MSEVSTRAASVLTVTVRGRFAIRDESGRDATPTNRKDRALIGLLAVAPDRRRSRQWLQSMLWSESPPEKASANLRRSLANLRRTFGETAPLFQSSRLEVWLDDTVRIDRKSALAGTAELLELIDAPDPAFETWLRDLRATDAAEIAAQPPAETGTLTATHAQGGTIVVVTSKAPQETSEGSFLEAILTDILSSRMQAEGAEEIYVDVAPDPARIARAATIIHIELFSVAADGFWTVHLRALADQQRRFLWSGRLRLPLQVSQLADGIEAQAFVSRALSQILMRYHAFRNASVSPLMVMQRAATRLYDPDPIKVRSAESDLETLSSGEGMAMALAWRGFARLSRRLEFGELDMAEEAEGLIGEAYTRRPDSALITALASRVALDVSADFDRARHMAQAAMQSDERNPYALQAMARIALMQGRTDEAHLVARTARHAADGLPHIFAWDFECCLTALGRFDLHGAHQAARTAHRANPLHRASLRYLIATSLLIGEEQEARRAAARLAEIEPGFRISDLRRPDYPVLTLRRMGLTQELPDI